MVTLITFPLILFLKNLGIGHTLLCKTFDLEGEVAFGAEDPWEVATLMLEGLEC